MNEYYTEDIQSLALFIFGPYLEKYSYDIPKNGSLKVFHFLAYFLFKIGGFIRKWKWKLKKHSNRKSIEGTIYGDIQREER